MYATQTSINNKQREVIHQPYELSIIKDQIHKFPDYMRKSIKLNRHKQKANHLRNRQRNTLNFGNNDFDKLNINICRVLNQKQQEKIFNYISLPNKIETYENTTDRMFDMRRKLSPMKIGNHNNPKKFYSEKSVRERKPQQTVFLNIEKVNLIKIYSQIQRKIDSTNRGNSLETRYLQTIDLFPLQKEQKTFKEVAVSLGKHLKQGYSLKQPIKNFKIKNKQFSPPFQRYYYKDFIWKVAFSNGISMTCIPQETKFKVFVGKGNNSQLIRSLIKRRGWWTFTQKWQEANLVWTQLKLNGYFNLQVGYQSKSFEIKQNLSKEVIARNEHNLKIMNENDVLVWDNYWTKYQKIQQNINEDLNKRKFYIKKSDMIVATSKTIRLQNHFPQNYIIGNKKALLYTMTQYYESIGKKVFNYLPLSFHIKKGINDQEYSNFLKRFYQRKKDGKKNEFNNVWIVKPGQLTNRGNGITVCFSLQQIKSILKKGGLHGDGTAKTFIVQQYIQKPFLYQKRKFDIRHYMLATIVNGRFKGYWFKRGYIRTSSAQYTLNHSQANVHLTNDAVQKLLSDYGRYEKGNKLSYQQFQMYLQKEYESKYSFFKVIYPQLKSMATDALKASSFGMDLSRKQSNFELFGMDFMIDGQFKPWLIEINSNPCLELSCPLLADIIPCLVENTLKICVDSIVCPPNQFSQKRPKFQDNALIKNQFELVYDSIFEQRQPKSEKSNDKLLLDKNQFEKDEDEVFQDDGQAFDD